MCFVKGARIRVVAHKFIKSVSGPTACREKLEATRNLQKQRQRSQVCTISGHQTGELSFPC